MPVRKIKDFPKAFKNFKEDLFPMGIRRVLFLKSEWNDFKKSKGVSILYALYRGLYMIYFQATMIYGMHCRVDFYYTFLTNWTIILQAIYGTLFFIEVFYHYILEKFKKEDYAEMDHLLPSSLTVLEKAIWVLFSIVSVVPLVISLVYWSILYRTTHSNSNPKEIRTYCDEVSNFLSHGGNSVFSITELFVNALPVHVTHFVYLVIYAASYITFTGLYEVAYGKYLFERNYIYKILNWRENPLLAFAVSLAIIIFGVVIHLILWAIYISRLFIVNRLLHYDVYSYHEYTYRTKGNTPCFILSEIVVETPANLPHTVNSGSVVYSVEDQISSKGQSELWSDELHDSITATDDSKQSIIT